MAMGMGPRTANGRLNSNGKRGLRPFSLIPRPCWLLKGHPPANLPLNLHSHHMPPSSLKMTQTSTNVNFQGRFMLSCLISFSRRSKLLYSLRYISMVVSFDNKHQQKESAVGKEFRSVDRHLAVKGRVVCQFVSLLELVRYQEGIKGAAHEGCRA